ncbi:hypothetical protein, partial [Streptomyces sp. NPDC005486]|uniref:hypothetical protein n=1 Tax=Streptomyces sp. NPDC005486 TaxID=3155345 RepID=UPI0033A6BEFB
GGVELGAGLRARQLQPILQAVLRAEDLSVWDRASENVSVWDRASEDLSVWDRASEDLSVWDRSCDELSVWDQAPVWDRVQEPQAA